MDGISTWSCKKYKQSYRDFLFFHCNKNLFSRCRNYKTFQCIWCNWPNVGRKLFTDKYLAWYTLCQSNGCMKSLQVLKGWVERMGYWSQSILLPFLFLFFFWCCIPASFIHVSLEHEGKYIYFVTGASLPTTVPHRNNNACNISKYIFLAVFFRVLWVKYLKLSQDYLQKGSLTTMIVRI